MFQLPSFSLDSAQDSNVKSHTVRCTSLSSFLSFVLPEKSGWLLKRTAGIIKRWQERYFQLSDKCLRYYHRESDLHASGTLNFDQVSVRLSLGENPTELTLRLPDNEQVFRLKAASPRELLDWAIHLLQHIEASEGYRANLVPLSLKKRFWRDLRIAHQEFIEAASTGDLLLFTSQSFSAKVQRGVTRSKYDHVALLLRYTSGRIGFLEATSQDGVTLVMWDEFIKKRWHLLYKKVVYRPLEVERTDEFLLGILEFIQESKGLKYQFSAKKLLFNRREKKNPGFFCSELVAAALQRVRVLSDDLPPHKYWPAHFSDEKHIQLVSGEFRPEELIDFEL